MKLHSESVYDETYIKAKVRECDGKIKTLKIKTFWVIMCQKKICIILPLFA